MNSIIPIPRIEVNVRPATLDDLPFMDHLQKLHTKQVGWMPTKQFEGKIKLGHVIVAEEGPSTHDVRSGRSATPIGYCIGHDQYFKRDDVGIIYQMNVAPGKQRSFVGATLLKAMFDRAAYGCKLFCCWCAQDIAANRFWESMGFVPLAFRAGSAKKARTHIFWQRRIRAGDETTPYWFPSQTTSGSIREDRLVLPIPPGKRWIDDMPRVLPETVEPAVPAARRLPGNKSSRQKPLRQEQGKVIKEGGLRFAVVAAEPMKLEKPTREPKKKVKNDPKLVAAARELRDRWLEQVNSGQYLPGAEGKYDVSRELPASEPKQESFLIEAA